MNQETTQRLLKESIIFLCRAYVGTVSDFEVDGIICLSRDNGTRQENVVFKIHELVCGEETEGDVLCDRAPLAPEQNFPKESVSTLLSKTNQHRSKRRKLDNCAFRKAVDCAGNDDGGIDIAVFPDLKLEMPLVGNLKSGDDVADEVDDCESALLRHSCYSCEFLCYSRKVLDSHVLSVHGRSTYGFCEICSIGFVEANDFDVHNQIVHSAYHKKSRMVGSSESGSNKDANTCDSNSRYVISSVAMYPISSKNHQPVLGQTSRDLSTLLSSSQLSDLDSFHSLIPREKEVAGDDVLDQNAPRECAYCGSEFPNFPAFNIHCKAAHEMFACPYCIKTFDQQLDRDNHLFKHTGEKPFECPDCALTFSRLDSLKRHRLKAHIFLSTNADLVLPPGNFAVDPNKERQFSSGPRCIQDNFDGAFGAVYPFGSWTNGGAELNESLLDAAIQSQSGSGQSPDAIEISDEEYTSRSSQHSSYRNTRIFDPDRTFTCDICHKTIKTVVDFREHCDTMHRRVPCPFCGATFTQKASMERHQRQHTGERPFKCLYCDHTYTRKENLQTHVTRFHPLLN